LVRIRKEDIILGGAKGTSKIPTEQTVFRAEIRTGYLPKTSYVLFVFYYLVYEAIGTAAAPGLLCQPRLIVKMIVEKQMECRLAGEIEVLGENLPQRHFCPSQNLT
jgi:hypothetical protein